MGSIKDDRGYNQGFKPSLALEIRTKRRCNYMIERMNFSKDTRILEIGCGTGDISYLMAKKTGSQVLGTDLCDDFIESAKQKFRLSNLKYATLDFGKSGGVDDIVKDAEFDYVIGNGILHHLYYKIETSLRSIHSLLKDNGKLIFLEPNIRNPYCYLIFSYPFFRRMANLEPGEMAFSGKFIHRKLKKNGFKNITVEYKDFLVPGTPKMLIKPVITLGGIAEKIPLIRNLSQSIFITATKR
jgi:2-polyprenyl-3-methyl-5-hydroxy-6-metoxy-1,4-benzoquinol methylase